MHGFQSHTAAREAPGEPTAGGKAGAAAGSSSSRRATSSEHGLLQQAVSSSDGLSEAEPAASTDCPKPLPMQARAVRQDSQAMLLLLRLRLQHQSSPLLQWVAAALRQQLLTPAASSSCGAAVAQERPVPVQCMHGSVSRRGYGAVCSREGLV